MKADAIKIGEPQSVDLQDCVHLGKLVGVWGVKGWLKVFSYTRPRTNISQYKRWLLVPTVPNSQHRKGVDDRTVTATSVEIKKCKEQGQSIVAHIEGVDYRDQAVSLFGLEVYIEKDQLKPLKKGEFYWSDMVGCDVINTQDEQLGAVTSFMETGANDVFVVQQITESEEIEHLIPYSEDIVLSVDMEKKTILVEWGADYLVQNVIKLLVRKNKASVNV